MKTQSVEMEDLGTLESVKQEFDEDSKTLHVTAYYRKIASLSSITINVNIVKNG